MVFRMESAPRIIPVRPKMKERWSRTGSGRSVSFILRDKILEARSKTVKTDELTFAGFSF